MCIISCLRIFAKGGHEIQNRGEVPPCEHHWVGSYWQTLECFWRSMRPNRALHHIFCQIKFNGRHKFCVDGQVRYGHSREGLQRSRGWSTQKVSVSGKYVLRWFLDPHVILILAASPWKSAFKTSRWCPAPRSFCVELQFPPVLAQQLSKSIFQRKPAGKIYIQKCVGAICLGKIIMWPTWNFSTGKKRFLIYMCISFCQLSWGLLHWQKGKDGIAKRFSSLRNDNTATCHQNHSFDTEIILSPG